MQSSKYRFYLIAIQKESALSTFLQRVFPLTASMARSLAVNFRGSCMDFVIQSEQITQRHGDDLGKGKPVT